MDTRNSTKPALRKSTLHPMWFTPILLLGAFVLASLAVLWIIQTNILKAKQDEIVDDAEITVEGIHLQLKSNQDYLLLLAKERGDGNLDDESFQERAADYVADHPEIICIAWVDANYLITDVAPLANNEEVVGLQLDLPESKRASQLAMETRQPVYTHPFVAIQGDLAFELWVPVYQGDSFLGLFGGIYSYEKLLHSLVGAHILETNDVSIVNASGEVLLELPPTGTLDERSVHRVSLTSPDNGGLLQFTGYGSDDQEQNLLLLEIICLAFVIGIAYAMWRLKNESEAVKQAELHYHSLFNQTHDAVFILNLEGRHLMANQRAAEMLGYTPEELLHLSVDDTSAQIGESRLVIERLIKGEHVPSYGRMFRKKDGSLLPVEINVELVRNTNGDPRYIQSVVRDITERKQAEREATELALIPAENPNPVMRFDRQGRLLFANKASSELLEFLECKVGGFPSPEWTDRIVEAGNASQRNKVEASGREHVYDVLIVPIEGANYINLYGRDITESKQAEAEREQYFQFFHASVDIMVIADPNGAFLRVNPATTKVLGYSEAELLTKPFIDFVHPDDKQSTLNEMERQQKIGNSLNFENCYVCKDGSLIWLSWRANYIPTEGLTYASARDITERKRAEEALRNASSYNRRLLEASIDPLVTIGHDGKITDVNKATEEVTGFQREELIGSDFSDYFTEPDLARKGYQQVLAEGQVKDYPLTICHSDGKTTDVLYNATVYKNANGEVEGVFAAARDITERNRAEQALLLAEADYRTIFEKAPVGIFQSSSEGRFIKVNQTMAEMYGYRTPEEMIDEVKSISKQIYVDPSSRQEFQSLLTKQGEIKSFIAQNQRKDGSVIWTSTNARIVIAESGQGISYEGFITDITKRKQAEEDLRTSEEGYRKLIEIEPECVKILTKDALVQTMNPAGLAMIEADSLEQIVGKSVLGIIDPQYRNGFKDLIQKVFSGERGTLEFEITGLKGTKRWLETHSVPMSDEGGNIQSLLGITRDITERKQAQEALRESGEKFRSLLDSQENNIMMLDYDGVHHYVNQVGIVTMKGSGTAQDIIGKSLHDLYPAQIADWQLNQVRSVFTTGQGISGDFQTVVNDQSSWWHLNLQPIRNAAGEVVQVMVNSSDITSRKQAEDEIRELNTDLEKRVEERTIELVRANHIKDEFLAMMSHELRTPLTSILGFSETLLEGVRGMMNERQQNAVQMIQSSGRHLLNMINDILDISKIESDKFELRPENINVHEICKASLVFVKQLAEQKSITVEYASPAFPHIVFADPQRLKQILINLLNNAVKFTPQNGKVKLETQTDDKAALIRFSVTDTGIGVSPNDLPRLFRPFVQLDSKLSRQYEGTGLGLVLVKRLVEIQGGSIEVHSELGVGSCFTFVLPWDSKVENEERFQMSPLENEPGKYALALRSKVLIADDDKATVMLVQDYLGEFGYQVFVAEDGKQVLPKVEEVLPDIILMDIQMPFANGIEVTQRLRSDPRFVSVPIIALTAFAMRGDEERCLEAGMNKYLSKPVRLKELRKLIEKLLGNSDD